MYEPAAPRSDYAQPELQALLEKGVEPLKAWLRSLTLAHPALGFHATCEWDNNVLACYLSHFLPRLPGGYWQQDVLVVHQPEHWENGAYNRIFTQISGNCLIPDVFHEFLHTVTRAFGKRFISVREMIFWLEQGRTPDQEVFFQTLADNPRLLQAIAVVEEQEGGVIDRSTMCVLNPFTHLEWMAMLIVMRQGHQHFRVVHVLDNHVCLFGGMQESEVGRWFDEMRDRAYFPRYTSRGYHQTISQMFSAVTATGDTMVLTGPLSEQRLEAIAAEMKEAQENRAILAFLETVWGDSATITHIRLHRLSSMGEEAVSACQAFDAHGKECFPRLDQPFWQEQFSRFPALQAEAQACDGEEGRLGVLNGFLFRQRLFRAFGLPHPGSEHPAFQCTVRLAALPTSLPHLYERG